MIHTSGAKVIAWKMEGNPEIWGEYIPRRWRYDNWEGACKLADVASPGCHDTHVLPEWATHHDVDLAIIQGYRNHSGTIRTAIVRPLKVYHPLRFPLFTQFIQLPCKLNVFLRCGHAFTIKNNENKWNASYTQEIRRARAQFVLTRIKTMGFCPTGLVVCFNS